MKIRDLDAESLYREFLNSWENTLPKVSSGLKPLKNQPGQSTQRREAGFTAFSRFAELLCPYFTVITICRKQDKTWIDIFDAIWNGIVGSVVVWFVFQAGDVVMSWEEPIREWWREYFRKSGRKEMWKGVLVELDSLRSKGASDKEVIQAIEKVCSASEDR